MILLVQPVFNIWD